MGPGHTCVWSSVQFNGTAGDIETKIAPWNQNEEGGVYSQGNQLSVDIAHLLPLTSLCPYSPQFVSLLNTGITGTFYKRGPPYVIH